MNTARTGLSCGLAMRRTGGNRDERQSSGKTDVVKGRIKETAGVLTGNDAHRFGSREGQAGGSESRRHGEESRERSDRVINQGVMRCKLP